MDTELAHSCHSSSCFSECTAFLRASVYHKNVWVNTKLDKDEQKKHLPVSTCSRPPIHEARSLHILGRSRSSAGYRMYWYTVCQHPFCTKIREIQGEDAPSFFRYEKDLRMGITIYNIPQDIFTGKIVDFWFQREVNTALVQVFRRPILTNGKHLVSTVGVQENKSLPSIVLPTDREPCWSHSRLRTKRDWWWWGVSMCVTEWEQCLPDVWEKSTHSQ